MLCASVSGNSLVISGAVVDASQCEAVVLTGSEASLVKLFSFPSSTSSGTVWALGFSLVVGSYLIGWACGAVLNFIKRY